MSSVINTNSLSLLTQNNLTKSQSALNTSIQRLSSGLRINSAKDDAAGQAIANRFTANIRGLTQASRNANDGISLAQTTEGALNEINTNLQRVRELTVQSANGSNSAADKTSIQAEITQRLDEIDRTSRQTDFNGVKVLSASATKLDIQVGAQDAEIISIDLKEISASTLGLTGFTVQTGIDATKVSATVATTARVGTAVPVDISTATAPVADVGTAGATGSFAGGVVTDGTSYFAEYTGGTAADGTTPAGNGFYAVTFDAAGAATVDSSATVSAPVSPTAVTSMNASVTLTGAEAANVYAYSGTEAGAPTNVIKDMSSGTAAYFNAEIASNGAVTRGSALAVGSATADPLKALDKALATVDTLRGSLGAVQNRFDSVISNLGSTINNLSSSRSRIEDADYAVEVSNMTRAQILQQAGTSVLAKANQSTQGVMSLLQ